MPISSIGLSPRTVLKCGTVITSVGSHIADQAVSVLYIGRGQEIELVAPSVQLGFCLNLVFLQNFRRDALRETHRSAKPEKNRSAKIRIGHQIHTVKHPKPG